MVVCFLIMVIEVKDLLIGGVIVCDMYNKMCKVEIGGIDNYVVIKSVFIV